MGGRGHTEMGILVILVISRPEEGPDDTSPLDGSEGQPEGPHHGLVGPAREGYVVRRERIRVLSLLLKPAPRC